MGLSPLKKLIARAEQHSANEKRKVVQFGLSDGNRTDADLHRAMVHLGRGIAEGEDREELMRLKLGVFTELLGYRERGSGKISPSEACDESQWCGRKFYLDLASWPADNNYASASDTDNQLNRLFDLGTMVHWYVQASLLRAGHLEAAEVRVRAPEFGVSGSADGVLREVEVVHADGRKELARALLEVKTMSTFQFQKLTGPVEKQVRQASIYAYFLGLEWILMLYYDKNTSELKSYVVPVDVAFVGRFKNLAASLTRKLAENRAKLPAASTAAHDLPARACPAISCARAANCPYAKACFTLMPDTP